MWTILKTMVIRLENHNLSDLKLPDKQEYGVDILQGLRDFIQKHLYHVLHLISHSFVKQNVLKYQRQIDYFTLLYMFQELMFGSIQM